MLNFYSFKNEKLESSAPILLVSSEDLESVVRGILEELISASNDEKDESLLTVQQAASLLGIDRSTLWRWEKEGYLKPIRIGRKVRYPMYALNALIKGGEHGSRA